jgi:hypothetical protein
MQTAASPPPHNQLRSIVGGSLAWFFALIGRGRDLSIASGGLNLIHQPKPWAIQYRKRHTLFFCDCCFIKRDPYIVWALIEWIGVINLSTWLAINRFDKKHLAIAHGPH